MVPDSDNTNTNPEAPRSAEGSLEADCPGEDALDAQPTPRSLTFRYLSILWILPTFGAVLILLAQSQKVLSKPSLAEKLRAISIEQWLALVLLLLHLVFIGLARHYRRKENKAGVAGS